ncbi:kinase-like domain-containing protein [Mycena metata]|uniref:Kinase-like domain-containing protein n=1 Tax=Mycena metata TaxID=1033252 RepID=A0AAD7J977_9AGAR|nr:kinase-like domain-containing protein [Mycena metata]
MPPKYHRRLGVLMSNSESLPIVFSRESATSVGRRTLDTVPPLIAWLDDVIKDEPDASTFLELDIQRLLSLADSQQQEGDMLESRTTGNVMENLQAAYIAYGRAARLLLKHIPSHPQFETGLSVLDRSILSADQGAVAREIVSIRTRLIEICQTPTEFAGFGFDSAEMRATHQSPGTGVNHPPTIVHDYGILNAPTEVVVDDAGVAARDVDSFLAQWAHRESSSVDEVTEATRKYLIHILESRAARRAVISLRGSDAQFFLDASQNLLQRRCLPDATSCSKTRKLMRKLSAASGQLPAALFLTSLSEPHNKLAFGGEFGHATVADGDDAVGWAKVEPTHWGAEPDIDTAPMWIHDYGMAGVASKVGVDDSAAHAAEYVVTFLTHWAHRGPSSIDEGALGTCRCLTYILKSWDARRAVVNLRGSDAQMFLDACQDLLDRGSLPDALSCSKARKLMRKLSIACDQLPASLFITDVSDPDDNPTFAGGFGDSTNRNTRLQLCQEALLWQGLRHPSILPFLGIDSPSAYCMVSPWMKHGTVIKYVANHGRSQIPRLLSNTHWATDLILTGFKLLGICFGLEYLHSMKIVHGDLRGNNILVSDDYHTCFIDFGLASSIQEQDTCAMACATYLRSSTATYVRTPATDVYSFACVCIEMETGAPPFPAKLAEGAVIMKVVAGEHPQRPITMSDDLWALVNLAWVADFRHRPKVPDLIRALEKLLESTSSCR